MRTTLDIDDPVLRDLKRLQKRQKKSLGRLVSDLLAEALGRMGRGESPRADFTWNAKPMGARVDLADHEAVLDTMDAPLPRPRRAQTAVSFAVDVNVLLYASDSSSPLQPRAVDFLERCVTNRELFCLAWPTLMSYLRIATHPSIFTHPLSHDLAARNLEVLLEVPHVRVLSEGEGFWEIYREVSGEVPTRGNLVPDAHVAALLRQHGVPILWTADRDFLKFGFLDVRNPFTRP